MSDEYKTLAEAVAFALMRGGTTVMDRPQQLLSYISDTMDPESLEIRVLMRCCDGQLIEPYRNALGGGAEALGIAEAHARDYLINECMIEPRVAAKVSAGIAQGIGMRYGITLAPPQATRRVATEQAPASAQGQGWSQARGSSASSSQSAVRPQTVAFTPTQPAPRQVTQPNVSIPQSQTMAQPQQVRPKPQPQPVPQQTPQPKPAPQPKPPAQSAPQPQSKPALQQNPAAQSQASTQQEQKTKKSARSIMTALVLAIILAAFVIPRIFGGGSSGSSDYGNVTTPTSNDEDIWLVTDYVTVDSNGTVVAESHSTYDEHGNELTSGFYMLEDDGTTYEGKSTYSSYDEYGYVGEITQETVDEQKDADTYRSTRTSTVTNEVDSGGRITERWVNENYNSGDYTDKTTYHYVYTFDGNILKHCEWEETDESYTDTGEFTFDEYGHRIYDTWDMTFSDGDHSSSVGTSTYKLASDGTPITEKYVHTYTSYDGTVSETCYEYEFDEHGVVIKSIFTDSDGKVEINEYENKYDSNGNLSKRTNLTTGEVTTYTRIHITNPSFAVRNELTNRLNR